MSPAERPLRRVLVAAMLTACSRSRAPGRPTMRPERPSHTSQPVQNPGSPDAAPVRPPPCRLALSPPPPGHILDRTTEEVHMVAEFGRVLIVSNAQAHEDPSRCDREPESCRGDWAGSTYNPFARAWEASDLIPGGLRAFDPAHTPHSNSSAAGPSTFSDHAAPLIHAGRFETVNFGLEYMCGEAFATFGRADGVRYARIALYPWPQVADMEAYLGPPNPALMSYGRVAAAGNLTVALGVVCTLVDYVESDGGEPMRWGIEGIAFGSGVARRFVYDRVDDPRQVPDAPAVVLRDDRGVLVYRAAGELRMVQLDGRGHRSAGPVVLSRQHPGAPALTYDGDRAVVVFPSRASAQAPASLSVIYFVPGAGAPPTATPLTPCNPSCDAPALAIEDGVYLLAWSEGDARHGVVRVGASREGLADAVAHAITVSSSRANAREPEVAWSQGHGWITWQQLVPPTPPSEAAPDGMLLLGALRCL